MLRRSMQSLRIVVFFGLLLVFVFAFLKFKELQEHIRKVETREELVKELLDSSSGKLEELYKQNQEIEATLKEERVKNEQNILSNRIVTNLVESKLRSEKTELSERLNVVSSENERLKGRVDDLETELSQVKKRENTLAEEKKTIEEQYKEEYKALKQQRDKSESDLQARVDELMTQVANKIEQCDEEKRTLETKYKQEYKALQEDENLRIAKLTASHETMQQRIKELEKIVKVSQSNAEASIRINSDVPANQSGIVQDARNSQQQQKNEGESHQNKGLSEQLKVNKHNNANGDGGQNSLKRKQNGDNEAQQVQPAE